MKHKDELDEMLRRGANGPDGELAEFLMQMRSAGRTSAPVPSRALAAVLLATPVDMLTPEDLARSPRRSGLVGRRARFAARLAALAPATKLLLAGSVAAAAVTGSVVAANELSEDRRLRLDVVTPATVTSSPATSSPTSSSPATSSPTSSSPATSSPTSSSSERSEPGSTAPTPHSSDASSPSPRPESPSPRSTSDDSSPGSTSSTTSETETTHPDSDPSTAESTSGSSDQASDVQVETLATSVDER